MRRNVALLLTLALVAASCAAEPEPPKEMPPRESAAEPAPETEEEKPRTLAAMGLDNVGFCLRGDYDGDGEEEAFLYERAEGSITLVSARKTRKLCGSEPPPSRMEILRVQREGDEGNETGAPLFLLVEWRRPGGMTESRLYGVRDGEAYRADPAAGMGGITLGDTPGEFSALLRSAGAFGPVWLRYWFYWDERSEAFREYGGILLEEKTFRTFPGARELLREIRREGGETAEILLRGNGVIDVNYRIEQSDACFNMHKTLYYAAKEMPLRHESGAGTCLAAAAPEIADYPDLETAGWRGVVGQSGALYGWEGSVASFMDYVLQDVEIREEKSGSLPDDPGARFYNLYSKQSAITSGFIVAEHGGVRDGLYFADYNSCDFSLADLDGDGYSEVIVSARGMGSSPRIENRIYRYEGGKWNLVFHNNSNGAGTPEKNYDTGFHTTLGDGFRYTVTNKALGYSETFVKKDREGPFDETGRPLPDAVEDFYRPALVFMDLEPVDADGDGRDEVVGRLFMKGENNRDAVGDAFLLFRYNSEEACLKPVMARFYDNVSNWSEGVVRITREYGAIRAASQPAPPAVLDAWLADGLHEGTGGADDGHGE